MTARGYDTLTSVQSAVIQEEADARDLIVSAKTGSGKTVAFGLAIAGQLLEGERAPGAGSLSAWSSHLPANGDPGQQRTRMALRESRSPRCHLCRRHGPDEGTASAAKRRSHRRRNSGRLATTSNGERWTFGLRAVVLDEADEMLDMGFREELEEILDATPKKRRTLLFPATMPRPIVAIAKRYQKERCASRRSAIARLHADIAYQAVAVDKTNRTSTCT